MVSVLGTTKHSSCNQCTDIGNKDILYCKLYIAHNLRIRIRHDNNNKHYHEKVTKTEIMGSARLNYALPSELSSSVGGTSSVGCGD